MMLLSVNIVASVGAEARDVMLVVSEADPKRMKRLEPVEVVGLE